MANTDTASGVKVTVTTRTSTDIAPFRAAITAGARMLMVSSANYTKVDATWPGVFLPTVINGMIRRDLGYSGVVISDDLGDAKQLGRRAVDFIPAGGDIMLTVNPKVIPAMIAAVTARAATDATFRSQVAAAAARSQRQGRRGPIGDAAGLHRILGPLTVGALQRWLGRTVTGQLDAGTIRDLQGRIGSAPDGVWGPRDVPRRRVNLEQQDRETSADVSRDPAVMCPPGRALK